MGLLDGEIAQLVAGALVQARITKPATLIKVTPGTRTPGSVTAGTNTTTASFAAQGIEADLRQLKRDGTLIDGVDAAIRLIGATIAGGAVPAPSDKITIAGVTYTIVDQGVSRDAAAASYLCQCKR